MNYTYEENYSVCQYCQGFSDFRISLEGMIEDYCEEYGCSIIDVDECSAWKKEGC